MQGRVSESLAQVFRQRGLMWGVTLPLAMLAVLLMGKPAQAADPNPILPTEPVTATYAEGYTTVPGTSFYDVSFSDIDPGSDIENAPTEYTAWCVDPYSGPPPSSSDGPASVTLYNSYDPNLPADLKQYQNTEIPWKKINWILNNKGGQPNIVVQPAIWFLITGERTNWDQTGWDCLAGSECDDLVTQANNNPDFVPGPGQVVGIIMRQNGILGTGTGGTALFNDGFQETFFEWRIPPPPPDS